jgi:hypothetical protein
MSRSPTRRNQPGTAAETFRVTAYSVTSEAGHSTKKNGSALTLPFSASAMDSTYAPALAAFTMNSERMFSAIPLK